jgi:hypothetical protein
MQLVVAKEFSLDHETRPTCSLRQLPNNLMELEGEGTEDPSQNDVVQSSPIDVQINDVEVGVVVEGIATKREKHEVVAPLVVGL